MSVLRSAGLLTLTMAVQAAMQLINLRLMSTTVDTNSFAAYLVLTAASGIFASTCFLGINDSLLFLVGREPKAVRINWAYLFAAFVLVGGVCAIASLLGEAVREPLAKRLLGDARFDSCLVPVLWLASARYANQLLARFLFANRMDLVPNFLQLATAGVPMVVLLANLSHNLHELLQIMAIGTWAAVALGLSASLVAHGAHGSVELRHVTELLSYGGRRLPARLGYEAVRNGPTTLAGLLQVGAVPVIVLGTGLSLIRALLASRLMVSMLLIPRFAWLKSHQPRRVEAALGTLASFGAFCGIAVSATLVGFGTEVLRRWLARPELAPGPSTVALWVMAGCFVYEGFLGPIVDALDFRAHYNRVTPVAFAMLCVTIVALVPIAGPEAALFAAVSVSGLTLAVLATRTVNRLESTSVLDVRRTSMRRSLAWGAGVVGVATLSQALPAIPGLLVTCSTVGLGTASLLHDARRRIGRTWLPM